MFGRSKKERTKNSGCNMYKHSMPKLVTGCSPALVYVYTLSNQGQLKS